MKIMQRAVPALALTPGTQPTFVAAKACAAQRTPSGEPPRELGALHAGSSPVGSLQ